MRIHHFDKPYFDFMYEVEREQMRNAQIQEATAKAAAEAAAAQ